MPHLILELALWTLLAFFIGCIVGNVVRAISASRPTSAVALAEANEADDHDAPGEVSASVVSPGPASATAEDSFAARAERPKGIAQARGGKADNLQRISGIGPKNERTLHSLGFFHFDQIAGWSDEEVAWVDNHLKFNGRIIREEWILQAGLLAEGKEGEFERLYGGGRRKHGMAEPI
jgi:predicted flap endonuclease-1-like 5' DNA nuclease